jgi:hypothetical protein
MSIIDTLLNSAVKETLPEGPYTARIDDFKVEPTPPFGDEVRVEWNYTITDGDFTGTKLPDSRRLTGPSMPYLVRAIEVVTGRFVTEGSELFDPLTKSTGSVRDLIVGAIVRIVIVRREGRDGRLYTNIEPEELLKPPDGSTTLATAR